ncbi:MAG TPA: recombination regulator RecX, partial [Paraburkholderia sp.]|nr:recombination regulator RecX [Paraburkholderia sp.]
MSKVGRDTGGPRDGVKGEPRESGSHLPAPDSPDTFDPFESFDAHDRAAGRLSSARGSISGSASDHPPEEPVYTRSRRTSGDTSATNKERASSSQRPARSLKGRALGYLSRREYSRAELARKLTPFAEESDALEPLLDDLEREGWLSDS